MKHLFSSYYFRGLIPGPKETKEAFSQRIEAASCPFQPIGLLDRIYGVVPDWIPRVISSKNLLPWEAGCAWIDGTTTRVQLHPKRCHLKHDEILAHEAIHAIRSNFNEPRFEEILAYQTSSSVWRRMLGPLFQRPLETWLFLLAALLDIVQLFFNTWRVCATLLMLGFLSIRLFWNRWRFSRCLKNIPHPHLVLGLTDREIVHIAKGADFSRLDDGSLRWRIIQSYVAVLLEEKGNGGI